MRYMDERQTDFLYEMSEYQISAHEFFSRVLLDSLERNFGLKNVLISYFDTDGKFLSWTSPEIIMTDNENHPYRKFIENDVVRNKVYLDAVRDNLTYFDVSPRLYKSTDIISKMDYEHSSYVRFLKENFNAHYSITLAFGINAYIQVLFFKSQEQGDFTDSEIDELNRIYVYIGNAYKNFKKHEQAKIVMKIQNKIITSGEKAYLVTDDFMHVMSYNSVALGYLEDILGPVIKTEFNSDTPCTWLPFLLSSEDDSVNEDSVQIRVVKNYIFKIYTYDQTYSNGIVDRYHWITISQKEENKSSSEQIMLLPLTQAESRVAELMYRGLTYQEIADELVLSYHTIKKHVQNIYEKCGVKNRYQLYKWLENRDK